jgi:hypothetical protein
MFLGRLGAVQVHFGHFRDDASATRGALARSYGFWIVIPFASLPYGQRLGRAKWRSVALSHSSRFFVGSESVIRQKACSVQLLLRSRFDEARLLNLLVLLHRKYEGQTNATNI